CAAWDEEIGDGPVFGSLTVCDADTANLDPLTDELLTEDEFRKRQETFTEDARGVFEGRFDPNAGEYDAEEGMLPCDSWAGKHDRDVCMYEDLWPDTPMTEEECLAYVELDDCWNYLTQHPLEESAR